MRPNIDPHDFGIKLRRARNFLDKGHKVKFTVRYRPREMRHFEIGTQKLDKSVEELGDVATLESQNRGGSGMRMQSLVMAPRKAPTPSKDSSPRDPHAKARRAPPQWDPPPDPARAR